MDQQISFVQYTDNVGKNQSYNRVYDPETATPKQRSRKKEALKNPRMQNINGSSLAILISRYKREQSAVAGQRLETSTTTTATWTSAARAFLALCFVYAQ